MVAQAAAEAVVKIPPLNIKTIEISITGLTSLICHRFSTKTKQEMLDQQKKGGKAPKKRDPKDVDSLFNQSLYRLDDGPTEFGFPAVAFKNAMVRAAKLFGLSMTDARQGFFVLGAPGEDGLALVPVVGTPHMREDYVRLNGKTADIRIRGAFDPWEAQLHVEYNPTMLSLESVVSLVEHAGFSVGVGEWRPEKNGPFGRFTINKG
jgi:hypothetical protein